MLDRDIQLLIDVANKRLQNPKTKEQVLATFVNAGILNTDLTLLNHSNI
jgi:hypothetical protein